jgi:hypothetical protein
MRLTNGNNKMTDIIPDEDSIQKTQLWQRTIDAIQIASNIKEELYPQVLQTQTNTAEAVKKLMEQNKLDMQEIVKSLDPKFADFKKEVQALVSLSIQRVLDDNKQLFDSMIKNNHEVITQANYQTDQQYKEYRNFVDARLKSVNSDLDVLKGAMETSVVKFQTETIRKFSELYNEVSRLIKHIKKFADL